MVRKRYSKKASLNLSIEAIVIVVIAFVVLGLGLGFVRTQFSQIEGTSTSVQEQISQQILEDLRTGNKPLTFPASKLVLETREETVQAIGVKNTGDTDLSFVVEFFVKDDTGGFTSFSSGTSITFNGDVESELLWDDSEQILDAGKPNVIPVTISAPSKNGNYLYKVILRDTVTTEEFASKTFFIKTS